jgi:hypothetical protein
MGHSTSEIEDSEHPDPQAPDPADLQCRVAWRRLVLKVILTVLTAPYRRAFKLYTWKPIKDFRRADGDRRVLIPLVRDWKVDKYAELQSVQVAVSYLLYYVANHSANCTGIILRRRYTRDHIMDRNTKPHMGQRRSMVQRSHMRHLGRHNFDSSAIHSRRRSR